MKIIDPHLHFFDLDLGQYSWLKAKNPPHWPDKQVINKNFTPIDLSLVQPLEHAGFIHIEAGFDNIAPWRETQWLESIATGQFKTIANIDLTLPTNDFLTLIKRLNQQNSVIGFRHILDDDAADLLNIPQVRLNLQTIADHYGIFECQLNGSDTPALTALMGILNVISTLKIVINHAAFPNPAKCEHEQWQCNIQALSAYNNVYIKASGWEMIDRQYSQQYVQLILDFLLTHFALDKVMLASNFPLCLFSCSYQQLWLSYNALDLTEHQKQKLMHDNAKLLYQL